MITLLKSTRRPDITFYRNGTIRLTAGIIKSLAISPGDSINIAVENGEYLLYSISHEKGTNLHRFEAQCYPSKRGGGRNFCANSVRLCRNLLAAIGSSAKKVAFNVGESIEINGTSYLPIITLNPL